MDVNSAQARPLLRPEICMKIDQQFVSWLILIGVGPAAVSQMVGKKKPRKNSKQTSYRLTMNDAYSVLWSLTVLYT